MRTFILPVLTPLLISSCGNNGNETKPSSTPEPTGELMYSNELVGTWEVGQKRTFTMVFGDDGSWDLTIAGWGTSNGTYHLTLARSPSFLNRLPPFAQESRVCTGWC